MEIAYYSEDKKHATFNGVKYGLANKGYYRATLKQNASNKNISRLHRAIWSYHNGDIPDNYDIHHKDDDKTNNNINNLIAVAHGEHSLKHVNKAIGATWNNKPTKTHACSHCGEFFQSNNFYGEHQNKFCSKKCSFDHWYVVNEKPKQEKNCPHCGKNFIAKKSDQVYCNNICAQVERTKRYREKKKLLQTK